MIVKFAKQINGIGHFAQIEFELKELNNSNSIVIDNCNWKKLHEEYENLIIGERLLKFKESVIKGMHFALDHIQNIEAKEIRLIDIVVLNTDSNIYSMFAVGVISIFKGLEIKLLKSDLELIDDFVFKNFQNKSRLINLDKLKLSLYK